MNFWSIFWVVVAAAAVIYLWRTGQLMRLRNYCLETREELRKCTWPTWNELKGSTVVIIVSILLLGGFTMAVDYVFAFVVRIIT